MTFAPGKCLTWEHSPWGSSYHFIDIFLEPMLLTNFVVMYLCNDEIKHSDWSKQVIWLETSNHSFISGFLKQTQLSQNS